MTPEALEGRYGQPVAIDVCHGCGAFWFDGAESLLLAPRAILELMAAIHERRAEARTPLGHVLACPRCRQRLARTADLQRATRFSYWRCPADHGRFITFFDFLREKNFVRPLFPQELAELRRNLRTLTCSSCGAPVDLEHDSACRYCQAPLALVDARQVERVLDELKEAEAERKRAVGELPLRLAADRAHVDRVFAELGETPDWTGVNDSFGVLQGGLAAVAGLLGRRG